METLRLKLGELVNTGCATYCCANRGAIGDPVRSKRKKILIREVNRERNKRNI